MNRGYLFVRAATALAASIVLLSCSQEHRSPAATAAESVRLALRENGVLPAVKPITRTSEEGRRLISSRLTSDVLAGVKKVWFREFRFPPSADDEGWHLGVLTLEYGTTEERRSAEKVLQPLDNYFRETLILTYFSTIDLGKLLIVAFTESSGDARMILAVRNLRREFERNGKGVIWEEDK